MSLPMLTWSSTDHRRTVELGSAIKSILVQGPKRCSVAGLMRGCPQSRYEVQRELPLSAIRTMESFGLIRIASNKMTPLYQAKMNGPNLVFSDVPRSMRVVRYSNYRNTYLDPMWEGPTITNFLIRGAVKDGLDMGCGCGIIALAMASYCERVVALDVNPRALMFTRFNAALNSIKNIEVLGSDLFLAIPGSSFDRIVFNAPVGIELRHRNLLEFGEQILMRFFRQLTPHVKRHGAVQLNVCVKDWRNIAFPQNLRYWLGADARHYQTLFLENWRINRGTKFAIRRILAPLLLPGNYGKLLAMKRGLLFLVYNDRPRHFEIATPYGDWAQRLGPEFGESLIRLAMELGEGSATPKQFTQSDYMAGFDKDDRALAVSVLNTFLEAAEAK